MIFALRWLATGASLEFARILVIASEQSRGSNLGILEFPIPSLLTAATAKFRGQRKSRIPSANSRIPRDCFASLAMTKILEFPSFLTAATAKPKGQRELEFPRNSKIPFKIPSLRGRILEFGYLCVFKVSLNSRI